MAVQKASKITIFLLTAIALVLVGSTLAAINVSQDVSSSGTIITSPNIGVYSDSACTTNMTSINWGSITPGGSTTQTVYVKNTGTASMSLSMAVTGWTPSLAGSYITISWNKQNSNLNAGASTSATITLTVSSSITGISSFSNTITISGTG